MDVAMADAMRAVLSESTIVNHSAFVDAVARGGANLSCAWKNSHSQWGEDLLLLPTILEDLSVHGNGDRAEFVEIGAFDGIHHSNSLMLERCFGFGGVLIEANPRSYAILEYKRGFQRGRPNRTRTVHSAVCKRRPHGNRPDYTNVTSFHSTFSGRPDRMHSSFLSKFRAFIKPESTVSVPCRPMSEVLAGAGLSKAALLTVDVEGAEDIVVATLGRPTKFRVIAVEMDGRDLPKERRIDEMLVAGGMVAAQQLLIPNSRVSLHPAVIERPAGAFPLQLRGPQVAQDASKLWRRTRDKAVHALYQAERLLAS